MTHQTGEKAPENVRRNDAGPRRQSARHGKQGACTPSAWMKSPRWFLALGKPCSSGGSLYPSTNGSLLVSADATPNLDRWRSNCCGPTWAAGFLKLAPGQAGLPGLNLTEALRNH
jgi:hypothetical protein